MSVGEGAYKWQLMVCFPICPQSACADTPAISFMSKKTCL